MCTRPCSSSVLPLADRADFRKIQDDWPKDFVDHLSTSSVAFLAFHIWLAMLSLSAVYYESIAHLGAVVISHVLGIIYGTSIPLDV